MTMNDMGCPACGAALNADMECTNSDCETNVPSQGWRVNEQSLVTKTAAEWFDEHGIEGDPKDHAAFLEDDGTGKQVYNKDRKYTEGDFFSHYEPE